MGFKNFLAKTVSILLIIFSLYQTFLSLNAIFFIYPYLKIGRGSESLEIIQGLIEKALILYAIMAIDGIYGVSLLLKPHQEIRIAHVFLGILIVAVSFFFVVQTPFTTDPLINFIFGSLKNPI